MFTPDEIYSILGADEGTEFCSYYDITAQETYDGAIPSRNSVMTYNLIYFAENNDHSKFAECLKRHCSFMDAAASGYPQGHCFHLFSLFPAKKIICRDNICRQTDEAIL